MNAAALHIGQFSDDDHDTDAGVAVEAAVNAEHFRLAMRRVASSVSIVTFVHDGQRHGFTATAHCSVSMEPPSLLVCVNRASSSHEPLIASDRFTLNILAAHQHGVAKGFSTGNHVHRFNHGTWEHQRQASPPYLDDAAVSFGCRLARSVAFGTHTILIGIVEDIVERPQVGPLIYLDQRFGRTEPID